MANPSLSTIKFEHDGRMRSSLFVSPESPKGLLVLLHPIGSSGLGIAKGGKWLRSGYAVLAPDALALWPEQEACARLNPPTWSSLQVEGFKRYADGGDVDDLGFLDAVIGKALDQLEPGMPLFLVGHSNGCAMGFRVLAEGQHKRRFAAAALMAASWAGPKLDLHVPVLFANGDADPIRPWNGHPGIRMPWLTFPQDSVATTLQHCEVALGAEPAQWQEVDAPPSVVCKVNDSGRHRLQLLKLQGQGHGWPIGRRTPDELAAMLGPNNADIDLTAMVTEFFEEALAVAA